MYVRFSIFLVSALSVVSCGGNNSNPAPAPSPSPMSISIVAGARLLTTTAYVPNPLTVASGTTVTWVNNDTSTHDNIADGGAFNTGDIAPGAQASFTFQTAGSFPYHCGRHPGMVATINVQ